MANYYLYYSGTPRSWAKFDVHEGEIIELDFIKKGNIRLFGKVTDIDGNPVPSVGVTIIGQKDVEPQIQINQNCSVRTDKNGCYQMLHLLPGKYKLECRTVGVEANINIPEGQIELRYDVRAR